ncbi:MULTISPECIES: lysophospholipid acyltransferase family protein [Pseudonocardia]|uniref:lysophospholipid acyltransferase family protein n=1 Tax=Pseudonocardia TaxID=1847 RepID=UPI001AD701BE|nr:MULTISPECIES: lysophospholipid acyltransferase family protein [Pseudonocardia]
MGVPPELTVWQKVVATVRRRRRGSGFWFGLAIAVIWPFVVFGTRLGWRGAEHLPRTGGALLVGNHVSFSDPIFDIAFGTAHGRIPRFLAKGELWSVPVVKWVLGHGGHIPVYRSSKRAAESFTGSIDALARGEIVAIYPEGTYTRDPGHWPMKPKNGVARIALRSGAPVIPMANWGTQDFLPADGKPTPFPRKRVTVALGPPVDLSEFAGKPLTKTTLDAATAKIMDAVTGLLEELRGETRPATTYDPEARPRPEAPGEPLDPAERAAG